MMDVFIEENENGRWQVRDCDHLELIAERATEDETIAFCQENGYSIDLVGDDEWDDCDNVGRGDWYL